jgi:serine protease AprX
VAVALSSLCAGVGWGAAATPRAVLPGGVSWTSFKTVGVGNDVRVVVRARPGMAGAATAALRLHGGRVLRTLRIVNGFSALLPKRTLLAFAHDASVLTVTPDISLDAAGASYDPVGDVGSPFNTTQMTGAQAYWNAGYTGKGVDVALIDSGVVPVDGLTAPGKIVNGPDLSEESQTPAQYLDTYGHGTFMAGLIAGRANAASAPYSGDTTDYLGMAPDARIVSIKVADAQGATDVSQVIAAIDWVVQHRTDNGLNIRVLNLSYGTNSRQLYAIDPLAFAAEQAWKAGIVVVAAAGNAGFNALGSLNDPAYDPNILAVGAADTNGTTTTDDDAPASFSSSGTFRTPDLLAPGSHVVGLRDPGSYVDQTYGDTGGVTDNLFRGSGSSEAAAIVSGAAALLLQEYPAASPDQIKKLLMQSATFLGGPKAQGRAELNLGTALQMKLPKDNAVHVYGLGFGSLEGSRGSVHISQNGVTLTGEQDIFGMPFNSLAMAQLEASGSSWSGGNWNGSSWSGSSWSGSSWSGSSWSGSSWSGSSWSGSSWSGSSWSGSSWSGSSWSGSSWSGSSWSGSSWSGSSWSGSSWSSASWS